LLGTLKRFAVFRRLAAVCNLTVVLSLTSLAQTTPAYVLGPDDKISVTVEDLDEFKNTDFKSDRVFRIDSLGNTQLPALGTVHLGGLTVEEAIELLRTRLKKYLINPEVNLTIADFRSRPVSIYGAVEHPGVQQIHGKVSLMEVLAFAGGINSNAANVVKIARLKSSGDLPLPNVASDATGKYWVGEVDLGSLLAGRTPAGNITVLPEDAITVPKADVVYVLGAVRKGGGFLLNERQSVTALQALAMAEGADKYASETKVRILREHPGGGPKIQIPLNLKTILTGKTPDPVLLPGDVLFIPSSVGKELAWQLAQAAETMATGVVIYRAGYPTNSVAASVTAK
jgi:polysaccharide export outer membrane protein